MIADREHDGEFLAAACQAMRGPSGAAALDALGWWELLADLDDADARAAVFAAFRAQGRELASSPALGGVLAQPFLDGADQAPGSVVAAVRRRPTRREPVWVVVGEIWTRRLLFDEPGHGVHLVEPDEVELHPVDVPGRTTVHEVAVDLASRPPWRADDVAGAARGRSLFLGRLAAAAEILGATEGAVELAVEHAGSREQFGRPIGCFQAVRHLLAWATADHVAIHGVIREALRFDDPPPRVGEVAKALAGRNGRRACERSLQVLGGIGFTAEHPHHHHHSRVLLLDALLGSSAELTHELGAWLRTGAEPGFAAAVLVGPSTATA